MWFKCLGSWIWVWWVSAFGLLDFRGHGRDGGGGGSYRRGFDLWFVAVGLFCSAVLAVVVPCFVVLWGFFFFFPIVDWWWWWWWLWLMVEWLWLVLWMFFWIIGYIILLWYLYYFIMLKAKKIHYCSICVGKIDKITFGGIKKLNI